MKKLLNWLDNTYAGDILAAIILFGFMYAICWIPAFVHALKY